MTHIPREQQQCQRKSTTTFEPWLTLLLENFRTFFRMLSEQVFIEVELRRNMSNFIDFQLKIQFQENF